MAAVTVKRLRASVLAAKHWIILIFLSSGVLAVVVSFLLTRWDTDVASLSTSVGLEHFAEGTPSTSFIHFVIIRNDGDLVLRDTMASISFSPTSGTPTIGHPTLSGRPPSVLETIVERGWESSSSTYKLRIPRFGPQSEISLQFNSDQPLVVSIDALGEEVQLSWVYRCKADYAACGTD
jgi:hypothetical protein